MFVALRRDGVIHSRSGAAKQHLGVSLIEVLVSIVIAAIGLLALAGVNATSVKYTKLSQYRGTATLLATDIGERMRASKTGIVAGGGGYIFATSFAAQAAAPTVPGVVCDTAASFCNAAQLAAFDIYHWRLLVRNQLPSGSIQINYLAAQLAFDVWVVWRDPSVSNDDEHATAVNECPASLGVAADTSVRCSYFRVNL